MAKVQVDKDTLRKIEQKILRPVSEIFDSVDDIVPYLRKKMIQGVDFNDLHERLLKADREMEEFITRVVDDITYYPNEHRVYIFKIKVDSKTYYVVSSVFS